MWRCLRGQTWCRNLLICPRSRLLFSMSERFIKIIFSITSTTRLRSLFSTKILPMNKSLFIVPRASGCGSPLCSLPQPPLPLVLHHPQLVILPQTVINLVSDVGTPPAPRTVLVMTYLSLQIVTICKTECTTSSYCFIAQISRGCYKMIKFNMSWV